MRAVATGLAWAVVLFGADADAHEPGSEPPSDSQPATDAPTAELSDEDRAAIEQALAAEVEAQVAPPPSPTPIQSMAPNLSLILDTALAMFRGGKPDQLGAHDPRRAGFNMQQLELHASAAVDPFFRFDANLVFGLFGVEMEEAYVTSLGLGGGLQARAGQFLTRFGRRNPTHPHSWAFLDQPLVLGKFFGGEGNRGLGAELSWLAPIPWYAELIVSATEARGDCCNRSAWGGLDVDLAGADDVAWTFALKQFADLSPDWGLNLGLSLQLAPNASGAGNRTAIAGADLYLRWKPVGVSGRRSVDLAVEVLGRSRSLPGRVLQDWGGFAELRWLIDANWGLAGRHEWVSGLSGDPLDPDWTRNRHRTALAADWYPSHFSRLRLQLSEDRALWRPAPIHGLMLGLEVVTGDHGSHGY
jgi:hypothetical protein